MQCKKVRARTEQGAGVAIKKINKQTGLPITVTEISSIPASKC